MGSKKSFIKNSLLFMLGSGLSKALGIIMLPLYTSQIPTEDYGAYDISLTLITIVSSIAYFELWSAVLRFMYDRSDRNSKATVVRSGLYLLLCATVVFVILGVVLCSSLSLGHPVWLMSYGVAISTSTFFCFVARGYGKNTEFTLSGILSSVVIAVTNIGLILLLHFDYSALYISYVIGSIVQCVYLGWTIGIGEIVKSSEKDNELTKSLLRFAAPLCLNTASYWLLSSASRLVFNYMSGNAASGVFSVGNKFGQVIVLATTCFTYAWQDLSFSESSKGADSLFYTRACRTYLTFLSAAFALLLPMLRCAFPLFVRGSYGDAIDIVPLALVVALISGYSGFVGNVFYAIKKTKTITVSTVIAGLVAVGFSPLFINILGANGVNVAVLLGFIVNLAVRAFVLNREIGFKLCYKIVIPCSLWIALSCVAFWYGLLWSTISLICSIFIACYLFKDEVSSLFHLQNK